jgi:hypothetical protein
MRSKKRLQPLMEADDHGALFFEVADKHFIQTHRVGAVVLMISSGLTTLPRDLLIFSPFSPRIMPWLVRLA